jgi:hypothetical protein
MLVRLEPKRPEHSGIVLQADSNTVMSKYAVKKILKVFKNLFKVLPKIWVICIVAGKDIVHLNFIVQGRIVIRRGNKSKLTDWLCNINRGLR